MGSEDRKQFRESRQKGIGGSDAAAVVGLSKWKTPYQLWMEKTQPLGEDNPTDYMVWGNLLEPLIRQRYCDITRKQVSVPSRVIAHPNHSWCLANLDGVTEDDRIFEAKTSMFSDGWGKDGSDEVPEEYYLQIQHYMEVTGAKLTDVAVLIGGSDFRILTVEADKEVQELLIDREQAFWKSVVDRVAPEPQSVEDVLMAFPESRGDMGPASDDIFEAWKKLREVREQEKEIETLREELELTIKKAIGSQDGVIYGGQILATWKSRKASIVFDAKAFEQSHPELHSKFQVERPGSRTFLLKQPKKGR